MFAKKKLGQNFLQNPKVIDRIIDSIEEVHNIKKYKYRICHEIGPGRGALTRQLVNLYKVKAIEKDKDLSELIKKEFKIDCINQDILTWNPDSIDQVICVGSLPYYITSSILFWFVDKSYQDGLFIIQKEVGERIIADHATKQYGRLSVALQLIFDIKIFFTIGRNNFYPIPGVDSCLIWLSRKENIDIDLDNLNKLNLLLFSSRRKMLRRIFKDINIPNNFYEYFSKFNVYPESRPGDIPPEILLKMANFLREVL